MALFDSDSVLAELPSHDYAVSCHTTASVVDWAMEQNPSLPGVMIIDDGILTAVISRSVFHELISRNFGRELFLRRSICEMLSVRKVPHMALDASTPIHLAATLALRREKSLRDEPVVVRFDSGCQALLDMGVLLQAQSEILTGQMELHRMAVESARQAEEKFRSIFENAIEGIFQASEDGRYLNLNPALSRMYGYDSPEEFSAAVPDLTAFHVDPARHAEFFTAVRTHRSVHNFEVRVRRKDGVVVWLCQQAHAVHDPQGRFLYVEGSVEDVTARKQAEQEREDLLRQYAHASREAGKAEIASGILHNVGNVLNSVNLSAAFVADLLRQSKLPNFGKAVDMIVAHESDLTEFLTIDEKGRRLPTYLARLAQALTQERESLMEEIASLGKGVEHIKEIVDLQQSYAKGSVVLARIAPESLFEDAVRVKLISLERHQIRVVRDFQPVAAVPLDKHKVLQILINLISNAKEALHERGGLDKQITLKLSLTGEADRQQVSFQVIDNGVGIVPENLRRIFTHGFTTRRDGHGFGLHSAAVAAGEMGGVLSAASDGPGKGAAFTLRLPVHKASPASVAELVR